jgi:MFS transporter, FSR family, fosmidomycin resistance protein
MLRLRPKPRNCAQSRRIAAMLPKFKAAIADHIGRAYLCRVTRPLKDIRMASPSIAPPRITAGGEVKAVGLVSAAHFVGHFHMLVVPPLFPLLQRHWRVGFVELGLALTVYAVVSVLAQLPMGWLADRFGSRKLLIAALCLGGAALASIGLVDRYSWLLVAAGLSGIANAVYHPADYAILSARVLPSRIGRAFSVHTCAGMLGNAAAPVTMLILAPHLGLRAALVAAGLVGPLVAVPLVLAPTVEGDSLARSRRAAARGGSVFSPALLGLVVFFILLSLSTSGITSFSVPALMNGFHLPFTAANLALTAYLTATALGVLGGGFVADLTRRHGEVAAIGFGLNALIILSIALIGLVPSLLVALMALAGLLSGVIQPSRDMLVRAAAPAGAIGRAFGIVTIGFSVGGTIGPMLFGWIMDRGAPHWIFGASAVFMLLTVATALAGDRSIRRRAIMQARPAAAAS